MKNKQNKLKIISIGMLLSYFLMVMPVSASTFLVSREYVNVKKGDVVQVVVSTSSSQETNYTFKSSVNFSSDILTVSNWQWADNWMPLSVAGYDVVDNTSGKVVKTAGYPSGIYGVKEFGVITFIAKKDGQARISFDDDSFILNADGGNTYK